MYSSFNDGINFYSFIIGNSSENLVPCPCNSSGNCFPFEDNGAEMCGCFPGYKRHMDGEGNQICIGIINF